MLEEHSFVGDGPARFKDVPIQYPMIVDGAPLKSVTVSRLRGEQVNALQDRIEANGFDVRAVLDLFCNHPAEIIQKLDQDDYYAVIEAVTDFLPERIRKALDEMTAEYLAEGQSSQTSQPNSDGDTASS